MLSERFQTAFYFMQNSIGMDMAQSKRPQANAAMALSKMFQKKQTTSASSSNQLKKQYEYVIQVWQTRGAQEALPLAQKLLNQFPHHEDVLNITAIMMMYNNLLEDGIATWLKIANAEQKAAVMSNVGRAYVSLKDYEKAEYYLAQALKLEPNHADALLNMGLVQEKLLRYDTAIVHYEKSLKFNPKQRQAAFNLGSIYQNKKDFQTASIWYQRALEIDPAFTSALSNLLFIQYYIQPYDAERIAQMSFQYSQKCAAAQPFQLEPLMPSEKNKRLHIGLVSGDLMPHHPVGHFIKGLLESAEAAQFDWSVYVNAASFDDLNGLTHASFRHRHLINAWSDVRAIEQIRADGIDVLIDLSGFTGKNRAGIFTAQAAPVQVEWLGWFGTTGLPNMQAIIADSYCVPSEEEHLYSERVYRLPHTRLCMNPPSIDIPVSPLPALHKGFITFGCFQNPLKINDEVLQTWAKIAQAVPDAHWHFQNSLQSEDHPERAIFKQKLLDLGFAENNLSFAAGMPRAQYFAQHYNIDLILDTFPYTGGTTTAEALYMGVPTLTLAQAGMLARQGEQMLSVVGLSDWITRNREDYIAQALFWCAPENREQLAQLRLNLREKALSSPLFDTQTFARDWCALIHQIWHDACNQTLLTQQ